MILPIFGHPIIVFSQHYLTRSIYILIRLFRNKRKYYINDDINVPLCIRNKKFILRD